VYTLEINIGWIGEEKVTITSHDFEKLQIIQEFLQFQEDNNWDVDYEAVDELVLEDEDDTEEELEGSESVE
jgi:hypothetical protein